MAKERHPDAELIEALGERAISKATGRGYTTVCGWKEIDRGIPRDFEIRSAIAKLAAEAKVALPPDRFPKVDEAA
jgi:hypothetical protein